MEKYGGDGVKKMMDTAEALKNGESPTKLLTQQ